MNSNSKKTLKKFNSFAEAEKAEIEEYRNKSIQEKVAELLHILNPNNNETRQEFQRVYRIIKLS